MFIPDLFGALESLSLICAKILYFFFLFFHDSSSTSVIFLNANAGAVIFYFGGGEGLFGFILFCFLSFFSILNPRDGKMTVTTDELVRCLVEDVL